MSNSQLPERFNRGDYVTAEDIIILVTGWGDSPERFAGVVVETKPDAQFPKRLGEHSRTWHTHLFKKIAYATKLHEHEQMAERRTIDTMKRYHECRDELYIAKDLLLAVYEKRETGLLPEHIQKIKSFLYDE